MHELSIALSIIDVAQETIERNGGGRITAVHLRLGRLSGVLKEALRSAYELASEHSPLDGSKLLIEDVPVEIRCPVCDRVQPVESIQEMRCRECGTYSSEIVGGRELEVFAMEVCDEQSAPIA